MYRFLVSALLIAACSKGTGGAHDLCERGCKKLLTCAKAGDEELGSCVQACVANDSPPDRAKLEALERASCDALRGATPGT